MLQLKNKYTGNNLDCGWISPTGYVLQCEYMQHLNEAQHYADINNIPGNAEQILEKLGWLKATKFYMSDGWVFNIVKYNIHKDITSAQIKIIREFLDTFKHYKYVKIDFVKGLASEIDKVLEDYRELYPIEL